MKIFKPIIILSMALVMLLGAPLLFNSINPHCALDGVNAQDNPCLAQDATISAMNVALLQATLDTMSYQATITALQNNTGPQATEIASSSSTAVLPFTETFDNNDRGWQLSADDRTSSSFSRGALNLRTSRSDYCSRIAIPNVNNYEFYLEVDVIAGGIDDEPVWNAGYIGFVIGQVNSLETYDDEMRAYLLIGRDTSRQDWYVYAFNYNIADEERIILANTLYAREEADVWEVDKSFKLALEVRNGFYNLFFNDEVVEGFQILPIGDEVGLVICGYSVRGGNGFSETFSARFDNLTVRQSR